MQQFIALLAKTVLEGSSHYELIEAIAPPKGFESGRFLIQDLDRCPKSVHQVIIRIDIYCCPGLADGTVEKLVGSCARFLSRDAGRDSRSRRRRKPVTDCGDQIVFLAGAHSVPPHESS